MDEEQSPAVWNMDEARLKELDFYMMMTSRYLDKWDLENAFTYLKGMRRVMSGKLSESELQDLNKEFHELQKIRKEFHDKDDLNKSSDFYNKIDEIFIKINELGKQHGLYFREKEDIGL